MNVKEENYDTTIDMEPSSKNLFSRNIGIFCIFFDNLLLLNDMDVIVSVS
jgi:hypothetical protein